jgi:hypothetical protein
LSQARAFAFDSQHRRPSAVDEHLAEVRVSSLTDA